MNARLNRFTIFTTIRVCVMMLSCGVLAWIWGDDRLFFTQIIVVLIIIIEVVELIRFVNHTNREVARFLDAIRHSDFTVTFKQQRYGSTFTELQSSMQSIIGKYKDVKIEKEAQYQLLQFLVQRVSIGIIFMMDDEIELINPRAQQLLEAKGILNWKILSEQAYQFTQEVTQLGSNGRKLIELKQSRDSKFLAIDVSSQIILDRPGKLITIQDINSEIEQKEIEAWHKLIRILTHEIMNSITPISSLTETMQGMLSARNGVQKKASEIDDETVSDMLFSLKTINTRSDGLLHFVENYRKLSRVPKPHLETVDVHDFMTEIHVLFRDSLNRDSIRFEVQSEQGLRAAFDPGLIQQVVINLITNSRHALADRPNKQILFKSTSEGTKFIFEIADTGIGIPEKELSEIFIPFFSTKQEGSGIGLSLSKQIISQHGGTIRVSSAVGKGTSFSLLQ